MFLLKEAKKAAGDKTKVDALKDEITSLETALSKAAAGAAGAEAAIVAFKQSRETAFATFTRQSNEQQAAISTTKMTMSREAADFEKKKVEIKAEEEQTKAAQTAAETEKATIEKSLEKETKRMTLFQKKLDKVKKVCDNSALQAQVDATKAQVEASIRHAKSLQEKMAQSMPLVDGETAPVNTEISTGLTGLIGKADALLKGSEKQTTAITKMMTTVDAVATTSTSTATTKGQARFRAVHASASALHSKLMQQQKTVASEISAVIQSISDHGNFCTETAQTVETVSAKIQAAFGAVKETIGTFCTTIASLKAEETTLKGQVETKQGELTAKNEAIKTLQATLDTQMKAFEVEKAEWETQLQAFIEEAGAVRTQLETQRDTNLRLQEQLTQANKELMANLAATKTAIEAKTQEKTAIDASVAQIKEAIKGGGADPACKAEEAELSSTLKQLQDGSVAEELAQLQKRQTEWSAAYVAQLGGVKTQQTIITSMTTDVVRTTTNMQLKTTKTDTTVTSASKTTVTASASSKGGEYRLPEDRQQQQLAA